MTGEHDDAPGIASAAGGRGVEQLLPHGGSAVLHRAALDPATAQTAFDELLQAIDWEQRSVRMFGRTVPQPRLVAWFGDGASYTYSGLRLESRPWLPQLLDLREICEALAGTRFNSVLANLYRDGQDGVSWHADDESELGEHPIIASVSLGAVRRFDLRHRETGETIRTHLPAGSVVVMSGASQDEWVHQVPRTAKVTEPRINLTFRWVGERAQLRRAEPSEARAVDELVDAAYRHYIPRVGKPPGPMTVDHVHAIAAHQVWVAETSGTIVGVLVLIPADGYLLLDNVAVHPDSQGQGIGRQLMMLADREAGRQGFTELQLYTHVTMVENIDLYRRNGWEEIGRGVQDGYDRVFFRRPVEQGGIGARRNRRRLGSTSTVQERGMVDHGDRKTMPTSADVAAFIDGVADERRRADASEVLEAMRRVTGAEPQMWGGAIIGFGHQPYTTSDGKQRDWFAVGLSPRKAALSLYGLIGDATDDDLLERLGKHTTGKGCLYVKRLDDIDRDVLEALIERSWKTNHVEDSAP